MSSTTCFLSHFRFAKRKSLAALLASATLGSFGLHGANAADGPSLVMPPAVVHAVGESFENDPNTIVQVADHRAQNQKSNSLQGIFKFGDGRVPQNSRASGQPVKETESESSYVAPAGGLMGNLFGGPKKAKKEHEDGRKATALPPPDPSTVNWNGIQFHQPKSVAKADQPAPPAPLRDGQTRSTTSGSDRGESVTNRRVPDEEPRGSAPTGSALRSTPQSGGSGRSYAPSSNASNVPSAPAQLRRTSPSGQIPGRSVSSIKSTDVTSKQLVPLPQSLEPMVDPRTKITPGISANTSSRRSDRRPIDDADSEFANATPDEVAEVPSIPVAETGDNDVPSVSRRELTPIEQPVAVDAPVKPVTPIEKDASDIPMLPPSKDIGLTVPAAPPTPSVEPSALTPLRNDDDQWQSKDVASGQGTVGSGVAGIPQVPSGAPEAKPMVSSQPLVPLATTPAAPLTAIPVPSPTPVPTATSTATPAPTPPAKPVVADATPSGPSIASERELRDRLARESSATSPRNLAVSKQLAASELPGVRVITEGPSEIMIRELTQYEVRVENRGSMDATGIVVRSALPAWAEVQGHNASIGVVKSIDQSGNPQLQWTIEKLPAGVVERLFVRLKATQAGVFDVATEWTMMPQSHLAKVTVREPKLSVIIDGPDEIVYGRSEKYRVRVLNPGDGDASNVAFTLAPDSSSPQLQKIGTIPAGKEAQFEIELTARELGSLHIGGVATADRDVKTVASKQVQIASANVAAELTGPSLKYQNSDATYHLQVSNTGKAVCESMNAELRIPVGAKYVDGIEGAAAEADRLVWKIDALQPGAVRDYDINFKLESTGEMAFAFSCAGSAAGRANVAIETRVEAIADLVLSISDPIAPAPVNADVVYEVTVTNRGSRAAEDVRIVAQFSDGIEPIRTEGQNGEIVTGQVLFQPIARIEPGSAVRLKVTAKADRGGDHRFRTEVRHGDTSLIAEEATMFMEMPADRISRRSTQQ